MNIVDEDQKKAIHSYDPQAPITRKGVLRSLRTGRPIEIREEDMASEYFDFVDKSKQNIFNDFSYIKTTSSLEDVD